MRTDYCVACAAKENLYEHHFLPRSMGGSDDESNIITLCGNCHAIVHGRHKAWHVSELTTVALKKAKQRGVKLGNPQNRSAEQAAAGRILGRKAAIKKADEFSEAMRPLVEELLASGMNYLQIAKTLNKRNVKTPRDKSWTAQSVINLANRINGKQ